MISAGVRWLYKICRTGFTLDMSPADKRIIFTLNVYWFISLAAYSLFLVLLLLTQHTSRLLITANLLMYLFFFLVHFMVKRKAFSPARHLLLLLIHAGIFFYDNLLGSNGWVFLFYIPFLFVTISLCTGKGPVFCLLAYILLPVLLFLITQYNGYQLFNSNYHIATTNVFFRNCNFLLALLLVAIFAANIIRGNIENLFVIDRNRLNLQALIDNTADSIWSIDNDHILTSANNVFKKNIKELFGIEVKPGFDMQQVYAHPDFPVLFRQHHQLLFEHGYLHDIYQFSDNRYYEIFGTAYKDVQGVLSGASFHIRDITEIKRGETELKQAFISLQALIDNTHASIWSVGADYRIIAANRVYKDDIRHIFGEEINTGYSIAALFERTDYPAEWKSHYERAFSGETFQLEYIFDDDTFELMVSPIVGLHDDIVGAAFYARNISKRKFNERTIIEAKEKAEEASRVKAQFLSNISHELRTPLNGIIALTRIMLSEPVSPAQKRNLEVLKHSGDHMVSLIDTVLDFNKIEADKVVLEKISFNLKTSLQKTANVFQSQTKKGQVVFETFFDEQLNRHVSGDITKLNQVLNNLLGNAFKFTEKGKITFSARLIDIKPENTMQVEIEVSDTGIGIAPEKLDVIFDSFTQADARTTRKYGGTGLGLTISKRLTELMGGTLTVKSILKEGTTFCVRLALPCTVSGQQKAEEKTIAQLHKLTGVKVLVVEDNPVNMMVVTNILQKWEMEVATAADGQKALEQVASRQFDIILMDLEMPVMDGIVAVAEIRRMGNPVDIIAFTAASYPDMEADLREKGMNDYVKKPFRPQDLHSKMVSLLQKN